MFKLRSKKISPSVVVLFYCLVVELYHQTVE